MFYEFQKAEIKVKRPTGGFYLMPDLTETLAHKY
jgi:hypothetical protein